MDASDAIRAIEAVDFIEAIDWEALPRRANADGELRVAARFWTATLLLRAGDRARALRFEDGVLREAPACAPDAPCDVAVSALPEEWEALLAPVPRPFYQDLAGASLHHGFEVDLFAPGVAAYYPALRRLVEILREARRPAEAA